MKKKTLSTTVLLIGAVLGILTLAFNSSIVYAIPSETPHTNNAKTIQWESDRGKDGSSAHNHRDGDSFFGASGSAIPSPQPYSAYAVWDDRTRRVDDNGAFDEGHGFINECPRIKNNDNKYGGVDKMPRFTFAANVPEPVKTGVKQAFTMFGGIESEVDNLIVGIAFTEDTPADITIRWADIKPLGKTDGSPVEVTFDSDPDHPHTPDKEEWWYGTVATIPAKPVAGEAVGTGDGATKDFYLVHRPAKDETVYVDGVKNTRDANYTIEYNFPDRVKITFKTAPNTGANVTADYTYYNHYHFFSTALHEIGHVVGLDEQTDLDDIMIYGRLPGPGPTKWYDDRTCTYLTGTGPAFDSIDPDSIDGVKDLYSIPAPDQGDAPSPYPWATHQDFGFEWLGNEVDGEREPEDDDDDDGVVIKWLKKPLRLRFDITISTSGKAGRYNINDPKKVMYLNAWVDWGNNSSWEAEEHVIKGDKLTGAGAKSYDIQVPAGVDPQNIGWARFRLDYGENVTYEKAAFYGEVEDYKIKGDLHGSLPTSSGPSIFDFELRRMLDTFIPPSQAHSTLFIFTECYGGDKMDDFAGRSGTTVLSATTMCECAYYGGYHDDAARALKPGAGRTSDTVHNAGVTGKDARETPQKQGPVASLEPTDPNEEIKSREVLVYAGLPNATDNADRDAIVGNFAGQPNTNVTTVGSDGTGGWDYPGTKAGLINALKDIGGRMNENEQFILFVTDHGDKHTCETDVPINPCPCMTTEISLNIPPEMYDDMILDPSNQPDFCIFSSGPEEISLGGISVNDVSYPNCTAYPLDYDGNGIVDEDEGFEYVFLIDEEILMQGENHIKISSKHPVWITSPLMCLGSGAIAKGAPAVVQYGLTISSTDGGSVTTPGEETFTCDEGTVVNLVATPDAGYQFVNWTGDVGTIADVNAASTTITMNGDYSVMANFAVYDLTISSTNGGSVTATVNGEETVIGPGETETISDIPARTVVDLRATPDARCWFVEWTGDVDTIADVDAASTTITMDNSYSIRADFGGAAGCFIATATYGTPMTEEVEVLREFRDEYLLNNPVGQALVRLYYWVSPPMAEFITEHPSLKPIVRTALVPAVAMSTVAVNTTPAEKMAMVGLLVLVSVVLAVWATRRRGRGPEYT